MILIFIRSCFHSLCDWFYIIFCYPSVWKLILVTAGSIMMHYPFLFQNFLPPEGCTGKRVRSGKITFSKVFWVFVFCAVCFHSRSVVQTACLSRARMHHKVVGNFGSEADV